MAAWDPPFDSKVLGHLDQAVQAVVASRAPSLLPASCRIRISGRQGGLNIAAASPACTEADLSVKRLNDIYDWLWLAGRPMPPRPLNYQQSASREIVLDERADMHLVWAVPRGIFLKPIPRYLLDHDFWRAHLADRKDCYKSALGFLLSYTALIQHESDFFIAKEKRLIPENMTWESWIGLVRQLLTNKDDNKIDIRYRYGELRLSRLNKVYWVRGFARGYCFPYQTYGEMFTANLGPVGVATVYIALVLTAMQLGLATPQLANDPMFQRASYGFVVFSILAPVGLVSAVAVIFLFFFFYNWIATVIFGRKVTRGGSIPVV
ncbi:hypothetical protein B0T25DRAFT_493121 [Lasiosphaeria hispida]|uniref:Subtilisin-like serine protease n=1 Tax=Lasiosphaeria hispida TaxID=260671 RepID=A0AAJ0MKZ7_9PEZI|nr:hypothetical protein B0T25DRAFT_493121 [Lasiosphaeria hispida]